MQTAVIQPAVQRFEKRVHLVLRRPGAATGRVQGEWPLLLRDEVPINLLKKWGRRGQMKRSISLSELRESLGYDGAGEASGGMGVGGGMSNLRRVRSQENMAMASEGSPPPGQAGGARTPMLSEQDLREHFNMPLNEVAKKFGMCTTALKKLCRKYGVMQWPHRKLRSLEKKIASLRAEQRYTTDGRGHLDDEIRKLEQQREALITGTGEMVTEDNLAWSPTPGSPYEDQVCATLS